MSERGYPWRDRFLPMVEAAPPEIRAAIVATAPQKSGILPSEMLLFLSVCSAMKAQQIIESGRKFGYSTEVVLRCGSWHFTSYERSPQSARDEQIKHEFPAARLLKGNGKAGIQRDVQQNERRVALLLDGPKNTGALDFVPSVRDSVDLIGIHDLYPVASSGPPRPNPGRIRLEKEPVWYTSDDPIYLESYGYLDKDMLELCGFPNHAVIKRAFVLGLILGGRCENKGGCDADRG